MVGRARSVSYARKGEGTQVTGTILQSVGVLIKFFFDRLFLKTKSKTK